MHKSIGNRRADTAAGSVWQPTGPLWERAPGRDENGKAIADFMMLIPGLKQRPPSAQQACLHSARLALREYDHWVVFADLNLKLNVLWISYRPGEGRMVELANAVRGLVPEAKLVAVQGDSGSRRRPKSLWARTKHRLLGRL